MYLFNYEKEEMQNVLIMTAKGIVELTNFYRDRPRPDSSVSTIFHTLPNVHAGQSVPGDGKCKCFKV